MARSGPAPRTSHGTLAAMESTRLEWDGAPASVRAAVDRALRRHQRDALDELGQILDAALRVAVRVAPAEPRVSDIVAEAGTSNQTFYRYFAGKNELMHAVMERGVLRVRSYLGYQMAKQTGPADQITAWVQGLLTQLTLPEVATQSIAISRLTLRSGGSGPGRATLDNQLGELLVAPLAAAGRPHPELDAQAMLDVVLGALERHVATGTGPDAVEREHLVTFCTAVAGQA
ncbi:TetR/AcrR family transcriptional regulator [Frankia tisae]|uniref:TetR/AcrR family transcriptional regulator n=1 Tax=Frankia tisae TaxID=2950104 RepID=UPI0021C00A5F|nr:TetR/AcrR family transcriptional regulator [Frankia tisae]